MFGFVCLCTQGFHGKNSFGFAMENSNQTVLYPNERCLVKCSSGCGWSKIEFIKVCVLPPCNIHPRPHTQLSPWGDRPPIKNFPNLPPTFCFVFLYIFFSPTRVSPKMFRLFSTECSGRAPFVRVGLLTVQLHSQ